MLIACDSIDSRPLRPISSAKGLGRVCDMALKVHCRFVHLTWHDMRLIEEACLVDFTFYYLIGKKNVCIFLILDLTFPF